jgi:5-hydroxyisourate hydrolase
MSASASLSTHVLDTHSGRPAAGLRVTLSRVDGGRDVSIGVRQTDADGRVPEFATELTPGTYRLTFDVGSYFADRRGLFTSVSLEIVLGAGHHHVPLLVSPFACIAYRGA